MKKVLKIAALILVLYSISETGLMPKTNDDSHIFVCKGCDPFP